MSIISGIKSASDKLETGTTKWLGLIGITGAIAIVAMMVIVVLDALGRRFLSLPIYGSYELTIFLLIIVFFASFAYCTIYRGHFVIDVITSRFPRQARAYIVAIVHIIAAVLCFLLASQLMVYALKVKSTNLTGAQFTDVPMYIFVLFGFVCTLISGWAFLLQCVAYLIKAIEGDTQK